MCHPLCTTEPVPICSTWPFLHPVETDPDAGGSGTLSAAGEGRLDPGGLDAREVAAVDPVAGPVPGDRRQRLRCRSRALRRAGRHPAADGGLLSAAGGRRHSQPGQGDYGHKHARESRLHIDPGQGTYGDASTSLALGPGRSTSDVSSRRRTVPREGFRRPKSVAPMCSAGQTTRLVGRRRSACVKTAARRRGKS